MFSRLIIGCLLTLSFTFCSCDKKNKTISPGICLSFDDRSINEWYQIRDLLNDNNVKVTFFITQPDSISPKELTKLRTLQSDGHEIGFHGNLHVISEHYIKKNSYSEYLKKEINDGLNKMKDLGFNCTSFAYPYGAKYWFTDLILQKKFKVLRGVTPINKEKNICLLDDVYLTVKNKKSVSAVGIDNINQISRNTLTKAIERALNNNEILMLYAHTPTFTTTEKGYSVDVKLLRHIFTSTKDKEITFYRVKDLNF